MFPSRRDITDNIHADGSTIWMIGHLTAFFVETDAGLGLFDEAGLNIDERECVTYTVLIKKRTNFSINLESKISFIVQYLSFLILLESNQLDQMIVPKSSLTIGKKIILFYFIFYGSLR
ncbi:hypothetical protein RhiirC2_751071 [Rhizophagus irregularis]|uniref:Uncharacterized protein n=1 Tax=Rhizophagus irregularis TaxID=588596 RepID=A0A2N1N203_9GLOM|nr:hypothetical protein RhiirC2_751071 [Rhizophagus irregularis]